MKKKEIIDEKKAYEEFYETRKIIFDSMFKRYQKSYYDKDVKSGATLKPMHVYALLQRRVIEELLI